MSDRDEIETVELAAIRHEGDIYSVPRPGRHHAVIHKMAGLGHGASAMHDQGFITSHFRFVGRHEALRLAQTANQIIEKTSPRDQLFSEDVW